MARKSDTSALASAPVPASENGPEYHSIEVRPISNGYVSTHTHSAGDKYERKEEYHREKPKLEELAGRKEPRARAPVNHLKGAVALLQSKGKRR